MSTRFLSIFSQCGFRVGSFIFMACTGSAKAQVEVAASGTPPVGTVFGSVLDLHQTPGHFVPQLRHGIEANSMDWPVSFYATFSTDKGRASCTAALVGPEVLLTAAHCVPKNHKLSFKFSTSTYDANCDAHESYTAATPDSSADFALCKLVTAFALPPGFRFETIATPTLDEMQGRSILLTGFGCTTDIASLASSDGKYRIGANSIVQTSNSPIPQAPLTSDYYRPKETNNLITGKAGANLCPGDSGGPAFQIIDGPENGDQYPNRALVGVNSRVVYADAGHLVYGQSLISAAGGPAFSTWAKAWAGSKGVAICGLVGLTTHCRGSGA